MPKHVKIKNSIAYKKVCIHCWLIKCDVKHDIQCIQHQKMVLFATAINLHTAALLATLLHFPPHAGHNGQ